MIWRLTYCNKKGVEGRIDIIKGDRASIEIVQGSGQPFTLSYKLDKNDKSGHIMTSSADIEIFETETFNIDDLKTSNETELKVEYFEDNVLTWSGFILPDFFSREIGSPNIVRMTASDRLTALKGVTLSDLPSKVSLRNLIELSLAETGLSLAIVSQIQINQGSINILDSEVLSQRLTDVRGRSVNCYDILMSIMVGTNSTIRQRAGQWQVYNKLEHELRASTIFFDKVERGAIRTIQPVASSVGVYNEFGGNRLHPNNYNFSIDLTNWTEKNGFNGYIDNKVVSSFLGGTPIYQPDVTTDDYLVNFNDWITNETNLDTAPFLESNNIPIASTQDSTVEVEVDISAVMAEKLSSDTAISFLRYAIIATNGIDTYALTSNGAFEPYDPEKINEHSIILRGGQQPPLLLASPPFTNSEKRSGALNVGDVNDFHINIRIYGSGLIQYVNVNFASVKFGNKTETPKGNLYKTTQGSNFTKLHDVETVIFGDYIRKGLNGYFYDYPIDDTSNLYLPSGTLSTPQWITAFDTTERPLLHHVSRQKSRLFSVAHDILKANINVESFDPLAIFQDCKGGKYVVVSANFDFLRSEVDVELEQIAYDNTILKRDFIYSYFGEGEDTIKSIGGVAGGGGSGGGSSAPQYWTLDEDGNLKTEYNAYSTKGLSALGLGPGGGGGGGAIDIEIGGRNLLLNSNFKTTSFNGWSNVYGTQQITGNGYLKTYTQVVSAARIEKAFTFNSVGTFTFSIKVKTSVPINWNNWGGLAILDIKIEQVEDGFEIHSITFSNSIAGDKIIRGYQYDAPIGTTTLIEWEQLERGTIATDWTPAPEDQVSDWSTTDVTLFSYIKNKPTTLAGYGITDAVDLTTNQTIGGVKSFSSNVGIGTTAPSQRLHIEASGAKFLLTDSAITDVNNTSFLIGATLINPARWELSLTNRLGDSITSYITLLNGNVGIGTPNPLYKLDVSGTGRFTSSLIAPKVDFGNGFTIEPSGTELVFKYNGVIKQRMLSNGTILATGGMTALST